MAVRGLGLYSRRASGPGSTVEQLSRALTRAHRPTTPLVVSAGLNATLAATSIGIRRRDAIMNYWKASTIALTVALGVVAGGSVIRPAAADEQPHLQTALGHLRAAKTALEAVAHEHGGHRARALRDTERAIHEVEEGIEAAKHPEPKGGVPQPKDGGPQPKGPHPNGRQPKG